MIRLEINIGTATAPDWQAAWLSGQSINMEHVNPVFDTSAGGAFSEEFELDCEMNRHIVGNVDQMAGESVFKRLYGKKFRLVADGVPVMYGIVRLDKEVDFSDGVVNIELASDNQEWSELLEGKGLHDLDFIEEEKHRIPIGLCFPEYPLYVYTYWDHVLYNFHGWDLNYVVCDRWEKNDGPTKGGHQDESEVAGLTLPKTLFVRYRPNENYGNEKHDYVNTDKPYDPASKENPFCHIRTCLQRYIQVDGNWQQKREYNVHEPEMMNSAPQFYVAYVIDRILEALGITMTNNALSHIPDFNRLAIIHSNCGYAYKTNDGKAIKLVIPNGIPDRKTYAEDEKIIGSDKDFTLQFQSTDLRVYFHGKPNTSKKNKRSIYFRDSAGNNGYASNRVPIIRQNSDGTNDMLLRHYQDVALLTKSLDLYEAYATADNLPDIGFEEFLNGIRDGFGIRFIYDAEYGTLETVLLRDVLSDSTYTTLPAQIHKTSKIDEDIRGFHLKYSASEDYEANALTGMLKYSSGSDDTTYNYYDYRNTILFGKKSNDTSVPSLHKDESIPTSYKAMLQEKSDTNINHYVDYATGDGYRFKVDAEAKKTQEWYPSLFEVGGYRDVIIGDTSDSDKVETISIGFSPVIINDVNGKAEYMEQFVDVRDQDCNLVIDRKEAAWPKHALMIEGETHIDTDEKGNPTGMPVRQDYTYEDNGVDLYYNEYGEQQFSAYLNAHVACCSKLNYDYNQGEPFFDGDCDFTLGILRGSGSDAHVETYDYNFDNEGNARWLNIPGTDAEFSADSVNACGQFYDYNGNLPGLGYGNDTIKEIDKQEAADMISQYFYESNTNLIGSTQKDVTVYDINNKYCLFTSIKDDGTTMSNSQMRDYIAMIRTYQSTSPSIPDASPLRPGLGQKLLIGIFNSEREADVMRDFLNDLLAVYYGNSPKGTVKIPSFVIGSGFPLSLKLKAEKPYEGGVKIKDERGKEHLVTDWLSDKRDDGEQAYYPIDSKCAKRGLFDRFYTEYAYFVLNRKIARMEVHMELATLMNIDMTKKYRIGDITGWIKKFSYSLDMDKGLADVVVEMYYL